jgi:uncharacterized BrkB/YihY/UPF0761 family membrane protein
VPRRPLYVRVGWTLQDYAKRVWDNAGEDNIFFLAGGIAFNILLAVVPFVLLLVSGFATLLKHSADQTFADVTTIIDSLLPPHAETNESPVHGLLIDIIRARGAIGIYSAVGFIWFSTRLFGSPMYSTSRPIAESLRASCSTSRSRSWRRCCSSPTPR